MILATCIPRVKEPLGDSLLMPAFSFHCPRFPGLCFRRSRSRSPKPSPADPRNVAAAPSRTPDPSRPSPPRLSSRLERDVNAAPSTSHLSVHENSIYPHNSAPVPPSAVPMSTSLGSLNQQSTHLKSPSNPTDSVQVHESPIPATSPQQHTSTEPPIESTSNLTDTVQVRERPIPATSSEPLTVSFC